MDGELRPIRERESALDAALRIIADPRRRHVVDHLRGREPPLALAGVAGAVAGRETGTPPGDVDDAIRKEVAASLHHVHLPTLAAAGVVDYDAEATTVVASDVEPIAAYLDAVGDGTE